MKALTRDEKATLALEGLTDCCALLAGLSGGTRHFEGYDAYFVPETFWYHRVSLRPGIGNLQRAVDEIAEGAKAGKLPPLLGWLDCDYPDTELFPILKRAGYIPVTVQRAMYLSLEGRESSPVPPQIQLMEPAEAVEWSEMTARGFGKPPETGGMRLMADHGVGDFLLWREEGKLIGGTLLVCERGNGGIHEVSTLPEYRRKGVGSALVGRALDMAAEKGCGFATLQASELGFPLYVSLGFEHVGDIHNWLLKPRDVSEIASELIPSAF